MPQGYLVQQSQRSALAHQLHLAFPGRRVYYERENMKAANLMHSDRLQRVLAVLMDKKRHTTRDLIRKANVCAVNSIISELRRNGIQIECEREKDRWFYALAID